MMAPEPGSGDTPTPAAALSEKSVAAATSSYSRNDVNGVMMTPTLGRRDNKQDGVRRFRPKTYKIVGGRPPIEKVEYRERTVIAALFGTVAYTKYAKMIKRLASLWLLLTSGLHVVSGFISLAILLFHFETIDSSSSSSSSVYGERQVREGCSSMTAATSSSSFYDSHCMYLDDRQASASNTYRYSDGVVVLMIVSQLLVLPAFIHAIGTMSVDLIVPVTRSFEFSFIVTLSFLHCYLFAALLQFSLKSAISITFLCSLVMAACIDAFNPATRRSSHLQLLAGLVVCLLLDACALFNLIPELVPTEFYILGRTTSEAVVNVTGTVIIFFIKNLYLLKVKTTRGAVKLVSIRMGLHLSLVDEPVEGAGDVASTLVPGHAAGVANETRRDSKLSSLEGKSAATSPKSLAYGGSPRSALHISQQLHHVSTSHGQANHDQKLSSSTGNVSTLNGVIITTAEARTSTSNQNYRVAPVPVTATATVPAVLRTPTDSMLSEVTAGGGSNATLPAVGALDPLFAAKLSCLRVDSGNFLYRLLRRQLKRSSARAITVSSPPTSSNGKVAPSTSRATKPSFARVWMKGLHKWERPLRYLFTCTFFCSTVASTLMLMLTPDCPSASTLSPSSVGSSCSTRLRHTAHRFVGSVAIGHLVSLVGYMNIDLIKLITMTFDTGFVALQAFLLAGALLFELGIDVRCYSGVLPFSLLTLIAAFEDAMMPDVLSNYFFNFSKKQFGYLLQVSALTTDIALFVLTLWDVIPLSHAYKEARGSDDGEGYTTHTFIGMPKLFEDQPQLGFWTDTLILSRTLALGLYCWRVLLRSREDSHRLVNLRAPFCLVKATPTRLVPVRTEAEGAGTVVAAAAPALAVDGPSTPLTSAVCRSPQGTARK